MALSWDEVDEVSPSLLEIVLPEALGETTFPFTEDDAPVPGCKDCRFDINIEYGSSSPWAHNLFEVQGLRVHNQ